MTWSIVPIARWNDFSDVDVIVAARHLDGTVTSNRPASKLYNAWLANVPAVLGPEAAFRRERRSELDYIEVKSLDEAIEAVKRLRQDTDLRCRMNENGRLRSYEFHPDRIAAEWIEFFEQVAQPMLRRWRGASQFQRRLYLVHRYWWRLGDKAQRAFLKIARPGRRR